MSSTLFELTQPGDFAYNQLCESSFASLLETTFESPLDHSISNQELIHHSCCEPTISIINSESFDVINENNLNIEFIEFLRKDEILDKSSPNFKSPEFRAEFPNIIDDKLKNEFFSLGFTFLNERVFFDKKCFHQKVHIVGIDVHSHDLIDETPSTYIGLNKEPCGTSFFLTFTPLISFETNRTKIVNILTSLVTWATYALLCVNLLIIHFRLREKESSPRVKIRGNHAPILHASIKFL